MVAISSEFEKAFKRNLEHNEYTLRLTKEMKNMENVHFCITKSVMAIVLL